MGMIYKFASFAKRTAKEDIVKVFSFNAISTLVRMLTGLISVKVVASIIGPCGIALLGQLNNFSTILLGVANGGINSGITKYVAEYKEDESAIKKILSNALQITLFFTFIVSLGLIILHNQLSRLVMLSDEYGYVFLIFGFTIFLYTLNTLLISILNGYKEFKRYVIVNISGTIVGLLFTICFVFSMGLKGALISAVSYQSVVFFVTFWICRKAPWLSVIYYRERLDRKILRRFLNYSAMTLVSLSVVPVSQMLLRGYVISEISMTEAGWWEAMNRISNVYLMVITTSFSIYYLPRLSEIKEISELRYEIFKCYKVIIPILLSGLTLVYLLRHFVVMILFSPDFYPMESLFIWQLLGDFFKISSWLLAFLMVAKSMTKTFIATEVVFSGLFVVLGYLFMNLNGVVGITQAYFVNYVIYTVCMVVIFRKIIVYRVL
ncbi:O-antigen translocase [Bacteroides sp. OF03-11BH]|nr:O-antigen translocase [Bacteroides sp. OF03-11BH]